MPSPSSGPSLSPGRWAPHVLEALHKILASPPGLAVFDFDDTLVRGDCADSLFAYLLARGLLRTDVREVVKASLVAPAADARLAQALVSLSAGAASDALAQLLWQIYQGAISDASFGPPVAYEMQARLFAGWSEAELRALAPTLLSNPPPPAWLQPSHGLAPQPLMSAFVSALVERGWQVWIVSASYRPLVQGLAASGLLGFTLPNERVVGAEPCADPIEGLLRQMPWGPGKVLAIESYIGAAPDLVAGDSRGDLDMLTHWPQTQLRLLLPPSEGGGGLAPLCALAAQGAPGYVRQPRDPHTGLLSPGAAGTVPIG